MFNKLKIGSKLISLFIGLSAIITLTLGTIIYFSSSSALESEASAKLAAVAELKTQTIEKFLEDRYGDIHIMTGTDILKISAENLVSDIQNSNIPSDLTINKKREELDKISSNYRNLKGYIDKYSKSLDNFSEIKFTALFDIYNSRGEVVFREGDQILSANDFEENIKEKTMYSAAQQYIKRLSDGIQSEKYQCPFLYCSSIEHCSELNKSSIHMSHPLSLAGLTMDKQKENTPVKERFSMMMIFDVNTKTLSALLQDPSGMGESGESFIVSKNDDSMLMLTDSRFEKGTALKRDLSKVSGLAEHFKRDQFERGAGYCINTHYKDFFGREVVGHNHMLKIGNHEVALITKMTSDEIFSSVHKLLILIAIISCIVLILASTLGVLFSRSLSRPIQYGVKFAQVISNGDFSQDMDQKYLKRGDEIGDLARALNTMSADLETTMANIIVSSQNLVQAVQEISAGNENLSQRPANRHHPLKR